MTRRTAQFHEPESVGTMKDKDRTRAASSARVEKLRTRKRRARSFIAWDGEGVTHREGAAQDYVLFGNSNGEYIQAKRLTTRECLEFILEQSAANKGAMHVGFAFGYDVNMILRDMSPYEFELLKKNGRVKWLGYNIEHVAGKWFGVYDDNGRGCRIADIFGFFQTSFLKAIRSYIADDPLMAQLDVIRDGKAARNTFQWKDIDDIHHYWHVEIRLLLALVTKLRDLLHETGFGINQWHGPGALANYTYNARGIINHKSVAPLPVRDAAAFAYAGGRFELFNLGRHTGPVYSMDINSAYPAAIAQLPSLSPEHGEWVHVTNPAELSPFGVYRLVLDSHGMPLNKPSPVFHRDERDRISYPWRSVGWYWTPEARNAVASGFANVLEGWEWHGDGTQPFADFVPEYYYERRRMKAAGIGGEKALKLVLNSLYGKMAQRVGWEHTGSAPRWHQLEWAGWVTSWTRSKLYDVMRRIPTANLVAVETDGLYTTTDPASLGIVDSVELGEWEVSEYEEFMYLQSGVYAGRTADGNWTSKYRGLDAGTLDPNAVASYLQTCEAGRRWAPITGNTTRFIGYRAALMREDGAFRDFHNHWMTLPKEIQVGAVGKRIHNPTRCQACRVGANAYDMPHRLTINSEATNGIALSFKHRIPWEDEFNTPAWYDENEYRSDLLAAL